MEGTGFWVKRRRRGLRGKGGLGGQVGGPVRKETISEKSKKKEAL